MDGDVVSTYADVTAVDIQLTLKEEIKEALVIVNGQKNGNY